MRSVIAHMPGEVAIDAVEFVEHCNQRCVWIFRILYLGLASVVEQFVGRSQDPVHDTGPLKVVIR